MRRVMTILMAGLALAIATAGTAVAGVPAGLPADIPAAASSPPPTLPEPSATAWPFPASFPQTSGTGRLAGGAALWSDFIYDDYGATNPAALPNAAFSGSSGLAARQGGYAFPAGASHNNGADIFRAGVGLKGGYSYWRVDWVTLADPAVPIAEWTFDTDANAATGASAWPAGAGVSSPGIEKALVVSGPRRVADRHRDRGAHQRQRCRRRAHRRSHGQVVHRPDPDRLASGQRHVARAAGGRAGRSHPGSRSPPLTSPRAGPQGSCRAPSVSTTSPSARRLRNRRSTPTG